MYDTEIHIQLKAKIQLVLTFENTSSRECWRVFGESAGGILILISGYALLLTPSLNPVQSIVSEIRSCL